MWNHLNERIRNHRAITALSLTLLTVVTYWGALGNSFVYDDDWQILSNPFVLNSRLWTKIFTGTVWSFNSAASRDNYYRPLQVFYYWVTYRVSGPNPGLFHVVQVLIYAATAWLIYRLGRELFRHETAALAAAALWVVHPLHVEAVAWIGGMADVGCGFFFLLGFLLFVRAEKSGAPELKAHGMAALAFFPALFFKEMAVIFPLLLVAYWIFFATPTNVSAVKEWAARGIRWAPYVAAVLAYLAIRLSVVGSFGRTHSILGLGSENILSAAALLGQNARLFFVPLHLSPSRAFDLQSSLYSLWPWTAILLLGAVVVWRKRNRALAFLIAWWLVGLIPCLDIRQLGLPKVADRFSYVPSAALCLAIGLLVFIQLPAWLAARPLAYVLSPGLAALAVFWGALTVVDIPHWRSNDAMLQNVLAAAPGAAWPHLSKGNELRFQKGDLDGAEREYLAALHLSQTANEKSIQVTYDSYMGLGAIAQQKAQDAKALDLYQKAADLLPQLSPAYDSLGAYYFPRKEYATAARYFSKAVAADPQDVVAHVYMGNCWMKLGKFREAADEFHAARTVDPTLKQAYVAEARALEALGDQTAAAKVRESFP